MNSIVVVGAELLCYFLRHFAAVKIKLDTSGFTVFVISVCIIWDTLKTSLMNYSPKHLINCLSCLHELCNAEIWYCRQKLSGVWGTAERHTFTSIFHSSKIFMRSMFSFSMAVMRADLFRGSMQLMLSCSGWPLCFSSRLKYHEQRHLSHCVPLPR